MDKELGHKSDLGTHPVYMDKTTFAGNAHAEIAGGDLVKTVETLGITITPGCIKKLLSEISGLTCGSTPYIGVHVNAPNTAWAKGRDISCQSGSRWAYGICIKPIGEQNLYLRSVKSAKCELKVRPHAFYYVYSEILMDHFGLIPSHFRKEAFQTAFLFDCTKI